MPKFALIEDTEYDYSEVLNPGGFVAVFDDEEEAKEVGLDLFGEGKFTVTPAPENIRHLRKVIEYQEIKIDDKFNITITDRKVITYGDVVKSGVTLPDLMSLPKITLHGVWSGLNFSVSGTLRGDERICSE